MRFPLDAAEWTKDYEPRTAGAPAATPPLTYSEQAIVNRVLVRLIDRSTELAKNLTEGIPPTIEAYREMAGELRGINNAIETVKVAERETAGDEPAQPKSNPLYPI